MFNYTITQNETKTMTRNAWEAHGYTLVIVTRENKDPRITIENPMNAPSIFVNDFATEKHVVVNWSALGSRNPVEAREYAEQIITATEVAEKFQLIIDTM